MEMYEGWEELREYDHLLTAKSMIEEGIGSLAQIAKCLKLSLSDVEALQKECEAEAVESQKHQLEA